MDRYIYEILDDILDKIMIKTVFTASSSSPADALLPIHSTTSTKLGSPLYLALLVNIVYNKSTLLTQRQQPVIPSDLKLLGQFSIPDDPVQCTGILFQSISDHDVGFLAFRGTTGSYEWSLDGNAFTQVPYTSSPIPGAMVHRGFYESYINGVRAPLFEALLKSGITKELFITGHSLGGALAVLATLDLLQSNELSVQTIKTVTFGAPRVGNQAFADFLGPKLNGIITHYRAEDDIVPQLPLAALEGVYYGHVGGFVYFRHPQSSLAESHTLSNYISALRTMEQTLE